MSCITQEDINRLKGLGFLRDKRFEDKFNVRVITRNGKITSAEQKHIAEASERFGSGEVAMTARQTIEIQGVSYANSEALIAFLAEGGLEVGGTGPKVRPVVSCKGTTCQYGIIDTFALSEKIHERFYKGWHGTVLPHKFKIAVGGCPNNCVKPDLNDIGIIGYYSVHVDAEMCRGCGKCQASEACPIKVSGVVDNVLYIPPDKCNGCGRCARACPFGAVKNSVNGYRFYIGGRWGKQTARGRAINKIFDNENAVLDAIERALAFYKDTGIPGERFADTISRVGFKTTEKAIIGE